MAGEIDLDKLLALRQKAQQSPDTGIPTEERRYRLTPGQDYQFTYRDGYPLKVVLDSGGSERDATVLTVGKVADLNLEVEPDNRDFLILDKEVHMPKKGLVGMKGLRDKEVVRIGRNHLTDRFIFPHNVSRDHVEISREDVQAPGGKETYIHIKDLKSTLGTAVLVSAPRADYSS